MDGVLEDPSCPRWKASVVIAAPPPQPSPRRRPGGVALSYRMQIFHCSLLFIQVQNKSKLAGKLNYPSSLSRSSLLLATRSFPRRPDIIMTENTFHRVKEDIRKPESRLSGFHRGKTPADSDVSALKVSSRSPLKGATLYRVPVT